MCVMYPSPFISYCTTFTPFQLLACNAALYLTTHLCSATLKWPVPHPCSATLKWPVPHPCSATLKWPVPHPCSATLKWPVPHPCSATLKWPVPHPCSATLKWPVPHPCSATLKWLVHPSLFSHTQVASPPISVHRPHTDMYPCSATAPQIHLPIN